MTSWTPQPRGPAGRFLPRDPVDLRAAELFLDPDITRVRGVGRTLAAAAEGRWAAPVRLSLLARAGTELDQLAMVRLAAMRREALGVRLAAMGRELQRLADAATATTEAVFAALARDGRRVLRLADLPARARARTEAWARSELLGVLTPLAVDESHPFPWIANLSLVLALELHEPTVTSRVYRHPAELRFALLPLPRSLPRLVEVEAGLHVPLEDVAVAAAPSLFEGLSVRGAWPFRITRDAETDDDPHSREAIEQQLARRRFGAVVRLQVAAETPDRVVARLQEAFAVGVAPTVTHAGMFGLADLARFAGRARSAAPARPVTAAAVASSAIFAHVAQRDLLLRNTASIGGSAEQFVTAAAADRSVDKITATLYRTAPDDTLVQALTAAARAGKNVTALVEMRARFDEARNIAGARMLEASGVRVCHGPAHLKTHARLTLVERHVEGPVPAVVEIGTGSAGVHARSHVSLVSARPELVADVRALFVHLLEGRAHTSYRALLVAPSGLRLGLRRLIAREGRRGERGRIRAKLGALADTDLIVELYRAARAGARVEIAVRTGCALRPGVPGVSERVHVRAVATPVPGFERLVQFGRDCWLGSADWLPRNLDRRVEVLAPVTDPPASRRVAAALEAVFADRDDAWELTTAGEWRRIVHG